MLRRLGLLFAIACVLAGLLFVGQGTGVFPYPRTSFMIGQTPWVTRGVSLITLGLSALVVSRSLGGR